MPTEALIPGVVLTILPNTPYALLPGPHRYLFSSSSTTYATAVGGSYAAITNPNVEPGVLYESGFIQNTAAGNRLVLAKKVTRLDTYAGKVAQSNPYAYWRLGEKTGTVIYDSMGNALNLTKGSTLVLAAAGPLGDGNTAVTLDGTVNSVSSLASVTPWTGWTAISFEYWVNNPAWSATHEVVLSLGGIGIYCSLNNSGFPFMSIHTGTQYTAESFIGLSANTWNHVISAWQSGDRIHHYVNGVEVATNNSNTRTGALSASAGLHLGAFNGSSLFFSGSIDDVALYNRFVTANEASEHYAARNNR